MLGLLKPTKRSVVIAEEADAEFEKQYNELASGIGVAARVGVSVRNKLLKCLRDLHIEIYDLAKVEKYMDKKGRWCWYPLRKDDITPQQSGGSYVWDIRRVTSGQYSWFGSTSNTQYNKPVPYPVLCSVKSIHEVLGNDVIFMVAALDERPDPFLGVMFKNDTQRTMTVIERWDEPSFRG